jgi:hypothetical protein
MMQRMQRRCTSNLCIQFHVKAISPYPCWWWCVYHTGLYHQPSLDSPPPPCISPTFASMQCTSGMTCCSHKHQVTSSDAVAACRETPCKNIIVCPKVGTQQSCYLESTCPTHLCQHVVHVWHHAS